jgi:predicted dinucleotide-binding enzyme
MMGFMKKILSFVACLSIWMSPVQADTIAVIGTGDVGGALGPEFAALGHVVIYGSRTPSSGHGAQATKPIDAAVKAEIVVLAVPGMRVKEIVSGLGDLSGKIAATTASWASGSTGPTPRSFRLSCPARMS